MEAARKSVRGSGQGLFKVHPSFPRKRKPRTSLFTAASGFLLSHEWRLGGAKVIAAIFNRPGALRVPSFVIASEAWQSRDVSRGLLQQRDRQVAAHLAVTNRVRVSYETILPRALNARSSPSSSMISAIHSAMSGAALSIALARASRISSPVVP